MILENRARESAAFKFNFYSYPSARKAFQEILNLPDCRGRKILLPAYIGQSTREGSGVFDPIRATKTDFEFYPMNERLNIDLGALKDKMKSNQQAILLLIHYWGFLDPSYEEIKIFAAELGMTVIEDFAHGFFTFFQNPVVTFDYAFFSLHKALPYSDGGFLLSRRPLKGLPPPDMNFFEYNFSRISEARRRNFRILEEEFARQGVLHLEVVRTELGPAVPHSFPVLASDHELKERLYSSLNAAGFGVVSLYHTLIEEAGDSFRAEKSVSSRILNLPLHQDCEPDSLKSMVELIARICREYGN